MKTETLKGTIENVVYRNESNDYTVLEIVTDENELVTAVGMIPMAYEGELVTLVGVWSYHKEFGKQFSFTEFEKTLPEETEGILQYLSSGTVKGVGPITALKIVNRFGKDTFDVIENHPEWLSDISGITRKKAAAISESFKEQSGMRDILVFCGNHFAVGEVTRVYKKYGSASEGIIRENPYVLCGGAMGIPFDKVDEFAKTLHVDLNSAHRILAGIKHILSLVGINMGHTALPIEMLVTETSALLMLEDSCVYKSVAEFIKDGKLSKMNISDKVYVMTNEVAEAESYIAKRLLALNESVAHFSSADARALLASLETRLGIEYATLQREAIFEAISSGVMILTGGPGTGKTTVVKALIEIFRSMGMKCVLAAPTGRAAKRMSEATSREAKTIHRMLEMERSVDLSVRFSRNAHNPLDENVIIVDEASMMDLILTEALMRAIKSGSRLILIGDKDQLPSVGAGNIFSDLINSGKIKSVRLTEIFRQSKESLIITNAHKINSGAAPVLNVTDNDFFFVGRDERDITNTVAELITSRLPRTYGESIKEEVQVITPSKKGIAGVEALNALLQRVINPPLKFKREKTAHGVTFREGDKVMQTVNNYDIEWERDGTLGRGIFNGDIGVIDKINTQKSEMQIIFDDRVVAYPFELLDDVELSYAITVHKSQGSEYPVVIIPMYYTSPMLLTRNLLYTAVTRARRMVILVGRSDIPAKMVENNREILRYTTLKERILNL